MLKYLNLLILCLLIGCTAYQVPTNPEPPKQFDLFVKNPNTFGCDVFLNGEHVTHAYPGYHGLIGTYNQTPTIHLKATYNEVVVADRVIDTSDWRKPSYTFYLPSLETQ